MANWQDLATWYLDALHRAAEVVKTRPSKQPHWSDALSELSARVAAMKSRLPEEPEESRIHPQDEPAAHALLRTLEQVRRELATWVADDALERLLRELEKQAHALLTGPGGDGKGNPKGQ